MFSEVFLGNYGFQGITSISRQRCNSHASSQTDAIVYSGFGSQSVTSLDAQTEAEIIVEEKECSKEVNVFRLLSFLQKMLPIAEVEIEEAIQTSTFNSFREEGASAKMLAEFNSFVESETSQVSSVAFNSRYTIAIGYKQLEHITWCSHKSMIMVYFSMRRLKDGSMPSFSLVVQGCVSSLEFHKTTVSILAGGTLSGEIFIWDLNKDTTALLTIKNDPAIGHSDCISTVTSLVNGSFISSSIDGSVAVWAADKEINVKARTIFTWLDISAVKYTATAKNITIPVAATSSLREDEALVGLETGHVYLWRFGSTKYSKKCLYKHNGSVLYIKASASLMSIYSFGIDGKLFAYHIETGIASCVFAIDEPVSVATITLRSEIPFLLFPVGKGSIFIKKINTDDEYTVPVECKNYSLITSMSTSDNSSAICIGLLNGRAELYELEY
ncbi:cytoplasmic dynein 2 intermediate chain 2-like [Artemia franciscana]|uniref:Uncharacterized protein n=1 Tax=Artemia franciscana TaxID=6661 RepID=A0AA88L133_ARTSF|nr:hypothetical protein QYM36_011283 [Artemia franciscana]